MQIIIGLVVAVLIALGVYLTLFSSSSAPSTRVAQESTTTQPQPLVQDTVTKMTDLVVKEFTVEGGKMYFKPNTMTVSEGDTVRITFKNVDGFHDFVLDEFNVRTQKIQGGAEEVVEFVASKTGTFEYYCSVGQHRAQGMKGSLTVTPRE